MKNIQSAAFASKPHYELLDGLRGVAALFVIWYHVFEGFATSPMDQKFNHGYLAVDFFFILSGFVIGYAYDDRWKSGLKSGEFIKRRLIRLHPMVLVGALLGAVSFFVQGSVQWDGTHIASYFVFLAMILSMCLIPSFPGTGTEVRGNGEMFPLNGPSWSLFFEYIGNILYMLFIRKMPTWALKCLVALSGAGLAAFAISGISGFHNIGAGWSLGGYGFLGGSLRLLFAFGMGLLLSRNFKPVKIKGAFWICSVLIGVLLSLPYMGSVESPWLNGLYESFCVIVVFPLVVWLGASGSASDKGTSKVCRFLGDISYPVYIIHYPFMYLFYAWVWKNGLVFSSVWTVAVGIFAGSILLAYILLKVYDEPVRKWLSARWR